MIREYSEKDVMFVTDMPLVKEESSGKPYSEYSSGEIKNNLVRFSMLANIHNIIPEAKYLSEDEAKKKVVADNKVTAVTSNGYFLNDSNVCYTYLFTERYAKGDFDFAHSLVNKRGIPEGETYTQITWLKDVWVSQHLYGQIQAFIEQINKVKPKIVVLAGKWALMLFGTYVEDSTKPIATIGTTRSTVKSPKPFGALNKFRGSLLTFNSEVPLDNKVAVIVMLSPAFYYQIQEKFYIIQRDYLKVASFAVQAKNKSVDEILTDNKITNVALLLPEAVTYLNELLEQLDKKPTKVSIDVETKFQAIDCIGLCWKSNESFTIPFIEMYSVVVTEDTPAFINKYGVEQRATALAGTTVTKFRHYWTIEEECEIQFLLNKVLLHNNCLHVGQNYNYDSQYYYKTWWIRVYASYDTMIQHHVLHNALQKDLASLASMYCDNYSYWKDEIDVKDNLTRWKYNGKDVIYTLAITEFLDKVLQQSETLLRNYEFQQHELNPCVVDMMNRGILVDTNEKEKNLNIFKDLMAECITKINYICGEEVNLNSTPQVKRLFKDMLGIVPKRNRKSSSESFGADAMLTYLDTYPEYRTLLTLFLEYKSIKVFVTNFLSAKLDDDGKMRCDYNIAGTVSYRFSSRKNVFGGGCLPIEKAEALTPEGWVKIATKPSRIMQYTAEGTLEFAEVDWFTTDWDGELLKYNGRHVQGLFTPEHRMLQLGHRDVAKGSTFNTIRTAKDMSRLTTTYTVICGKYEGKVTDTIEDLWLQLLVVCSADGWLEPSKNNWRLSFKKDRKKERLLQLIPDCRTRVNNKEGYATFLVPDKGYTKIFPTWLLDLPIRQRQLIIKELSYWDGHICHKNGVHTGSFYYYSTIRENVDLIQTMCHISGISASLTIDLTNSNEYGNTSTKPLYTLCISYKNYSSLESKRWDKEYFKGVVGCPITPTTMWLVRYDNEIHVTGNTNMANVPSKGKIDLNIALQETDETFSDFEFLTDANNTYSGILKLPNVKKMFIPPVGYMFFDSDYSAVDLCFVAYDSDCKYLKDIIRDGKDVYSILASEYYQKDITKKDNERQIFKSIIHGKNYRGQAPTLAAKAGLSIPRVKKVLQFYDSKCPEVEVWQTRRINEAKKYGYVTNVFGFKGDVTDFISPTWENKVVAWIGQSSTACLVNKALVNLVKHERMCDDKIYVLLQTHDSLSGIFKKEDTTAPERIKKYMELQVDYPDPLVIKANVLTSELSYGDCK
jgi:DNA polymerase I-like protein with 3'-5' exonuclease and polymerase domains